MNFDKMVEALIKEAMERGDFDNLPGQGRPLDLTEYFNMPEDVRVAQAMLKNAGVLPIEIELLQEIAALKERLGIESDQTEKEKIRKQLIDKQLQFNVHLERRKG